MWRHIGIAHFWHFLVDIDIYDGVIYYIDNYNISDIYDIYEIYGIHYISAISHMYDIYDINGCIYGSSLF